MKNTFRYCIFVLLLICGGSGLYGENIQSNIVCFLQKSIPGELRFAKIGKIYRKSNKGPFGKQKHLFFLIYKRDSDKIYYNNLCDGCVLFLQENCVPSKKVMNEYSYEYITNVFNQAVLMQVYDKDFIPWSTFKTNLIENAQSIIIKKDT